MENAAIILGFAALGGFTLAIIRFMGSPWPPMWLALAHGAVAATGLGLLGYTASTSGLPNLAQIALGGFLLAALGGATLFFGFHMRRQALPILFVVAHGLIAVAGYVLLLAAIFGA